MYRLIRPVLWRLDPEKAHHITLSCLKYLPTCLFPKPNMQVVHAMGLAFPHAIGLAAGLDKEGVYLDALAKLGFAFIELGTVTPSPQAGNSLPRLYRIPKAHALINRMGFNNAGVDALVQRVQHASFSGILGINIGKNKETVLARAVDDYVYCLRRVYSVASYVTINISSPNTPDLRMLQQLTYFYDLMRTLREEQLSLADAAGRYVPLVVKVSPDESDESLKRMADVLVSLGIDGVIATNTTAAREAVRNLPHGLEIGGLSGRPLAVRATDCLRLLKEVVGDAMTLIASGGIDSADCAREKCAAGASLLQVYTGLIYEGPALIRRMANALC
ncbi:MAG: dihydroorotate dehydrogenase (quinone) [Legionellales bacterium RIFCSPHIGHO2_12_FULL_42_9]|nr:MAG: dihydroorotate dehydrogenase (quinone) [Legionellales bacterium RIFCSPHIGHO2_12_FULL_42_9]